MKLRTKQDTELNSTLDLVH